jgi:hypothetical protein
MTLCTNCTWELVFFSFFLRLVPILIFDFLAAQSQDGRLSFTNQYLSPQFLGQRRNQFNQFTIETRGGVGIGVYSTALSTELTRI